MTIEFNTSVFEFAHGRAPRGRGSWAFFPDRRCRIEDAVFSPSMTYAEAKRWARTEPRIVGDNPRARGYLEIYVGS
jgi:hypothetical protein